MAVNSFETHCEEIPCKSLCSSSSSKRCNLQPHRLVKINFAADDNISTATTKRSKSKKHKDLKSPYLTDGKILLHSQVTEKRLVLKKAKGIVSSFNLAANIYKASSDEFKSMKRSKKVKKSVLTLPNKQAPAPNTCTVSDINDSEYDNHKSENVKLRMKKKPPIQISRKPRARSKRDFEFYDRDARYCSQMNIDLDCSSTDIFKNLNGDGKKKSIRSPVSKDCTIEDDCNNPHDVWAVLRNINRFQFRPSPPMSEESDVGVLTPKKKRTSNKKRNKRKDTRVIQTCCTEEYAYISSVEVDSKSPTNVSQSSSFDRITVIDKQDNFDEICQEFEKRIVRTRSPINTPINVKGRNQNKLIPQRYRKSPKNIVRPSKANENKIQLMTRNKDELIPNIKNMNLEKYVAVAERNNNDQYPKMTSLTPTTIRSLSPRSRHTNNELGNSIILNSKEIVNRYEELDDNFIYSDYSTNSDIDLDLSSINSKKEIAIKVPAKESDKQIKGITKVVLSKGQNIALSKRIELQKKNARPVATMPGGVISQPKMNKTEIKRQLANLKFPLVILGKDQVSSTVQVMNQDPPQFNGLDNQIWPFMVEWNDNKLNGRKDETKYLSKPANSNARVERNIKTDNKLVEFNKLCKIVDKIDPIKGLNSKDRKANVNSIQMTKKPFVSTSVPSDSNAKLEPKKLKPIRQLKDKVIKFLYKKSSAKITEETSNSYKHIVASPNNSASKIDANIHNKRVIAKDSGNSIFIPPLIHKKTNISRHPWSKAKWASEFIDTVIRKIKNGVYYNQEIKEVLQKATYDPIEASIQTVETPGTVVSTSCDTEDLDTATSLVPEKIDFFNNIPGFNNSLPALEIKTLNMNQIEVKHSITNIMVQFDVQVPMAPENLLNVRKSSSVIAMKVTESNTQIFKCKTSILNAMLPAELCSLLPKMLQRIMNANLKISASPLCVNKTESNLSTISEITCCESHLTMDRSSIPTHVYMIPEVLRLSNGIFSNKVREQSDYVPKRTLSKYCCNRLLVMDLLPKLLNNHMFNGYTFPIPLSTLENKQTPTLHSKKQTLCTSTALVPYMGINPTNKLISSFMSYDGMSVNKMFCTNYNSSSNNMVILLNSPIQINCNIKNISMAMTEPYYFNAFKTNVCVNFTNLTIYSLYSWFQKVFVNQIKVINEPGKNDELITYINTNKCESKKITKTEKPAKHFNTNRIRRKSFMRLYKRYRSASNICHDRAKSLNKISNLDDFLELIGPGKQLSSAFDDRIGKKILSSIQEMKSWISELNPRQALLILLLMNKKDTPNLVRFRPLLLQGIAVNRITRSTELDMEIEVIEREHLNKYSQYEGIFYSEGSIENYDNLLEELYWIAKTTASDYQRPFDESSENLLKSLLEKRKKLNPSYLRVMARYVGLGLLKSPIKSNK